MSPFRRFFELIANPSNSRTVGVLVILIIALAIPLTVNIAQKQQETRQHAAALEGGDGIQNCTMEPTTVMRCLYPDTMPWNCSPAGNEDCSQTPIIENRPAAVSAACAETKTVCTTPIPTIPPSAAPPCSGTCYPNPDAADRAGQAQGVTYAPTTESCSVGQCYKAQTTIQTCESKGGGCYDNPLQAPSGWVQKAGGCSTGFCYAPATPAGGTTSDGGGGTAPAGCGTAGKPYSGTCFKANDQLEPLCIKSTGGQGKSVQICQQVGSNLCWYDQYQDTTRTQTDRDAGCYVTAAAPPPASANCLITNPGADAITPAKTGDTFAWGGSCTSGTDKYLPAGTGKYYYEKCQQYSTGASCWFNGGIGNPLACPASNPPTGSGCTASSVTPAAPSAGTCKTDPASASTCAYECRVVNGVNMKCNIQNQNTSGVCSGVCTGQWNCAVDSACQNTNGAILSFGLGLDGIGTTGDVKNPNLSNAKSPNHSIRNLTLKLINSSGVEVSTFNGNISYSSGRFTANVNLGSVALGTYTIKIKSDGYLWRLINTPLTITAGTVTYTLTGSPVSLVTGDIIVNNAVDVQDYNQLLSCIFKTVSSTPGCQTSDLDDSGTVDLADFNLLLREFGSAGN